jgi:hypothetical protein
MSSDLFGLHGVFPTALRWNAELGVLGISAFDPETGERGLQEIGLGQDATFVLDLLTRERGYGKIKVGSYEMLLTPVGSPPPPWPNDPDFKPALAFWVWHPVYGEARCETCSTLFRDVLDNVCRLARFEPQAAEGQQPVIRVVDRVSRLIAPLKKSFWVPIIERVGWVPRNQVPGWADRAPTVPPPAALPILPAASASAAPAVSAAPAKEPVKVSRSHKAVRPAAKPGPADQSKDPNDELPPWGRQ